MQRPGLPLLLVLVITLAGQPASAQEGARGAKKIATNTLEAYQQGKMGLVMNLLEPATRRFLRQRQASPLIEKLDELRVLGKGEWSFEIYPARQVIDFKASAEGVKIQGRKGRWLFYPTYPTDVIHYTSPKRPDVYVFIRERIQQGWYIMLPIRRDKALKTD